MGRPRDVRSGRPRDDQIGLLRDVLGTLEVDVLGTSWGPIFAGWAKGVWLTAKSYLVQNEAGKNKYSLKGVAKKQNDSRFQRYKEVLDVFLKTRIGTELEEKDIDEAKNIGSRIYDQGMVTYEQNKLELSAYYDKRYVLVDGIHTRLLC